MMEARLEALFKKEDEYTVLEKFQGSTLAGKKYLPIFPYFSHVSSALIFIIGLLRCRMMSFKIFRVCKKPASLCLTIHQLHSNRFKMTFSLCRPTLSLYLNILQLAQYIPASTNYLCYLLTVGASISCADGQLCDRRVRYWDCPPGSVLWRGRLPCLSK